MLRPQYHPVTGDEMFSMVEVKEAIKKELEGVNKMYHWQLEQEAKGINIGNSYIDHIVALKNLYYSMFKEWI